MQVDAVSAGQQLPVHAYAHLVVGADSFMVVDAIPQLHRLPMAQRLGKGLKFTVSVQQVEFRKIGTGRRLLQVAGECDGSEQRDRRQAKAQQRGQPVALLPCNRAACRRAMFDSLFASSCVRCPLIPAQLAYA